MTASATDAQWNALVQKPISTIAVALKVTVVTSAKCL